jgi:site-specific recombinase XerD
MSGDRSREGRSAAETRRVDRKVRALAGTPFESDLSACVVHLRSRGYKTTTLATYVQILLDFIRFGIARGAATLADLKALQAEFSGYFLKTYGTRNPQTSAARPALARAQATVRGFLDFRQGLAWGAPRQPTQVLPFSAEAPGFWKLLASERGLAATTLRGYRYSLSALETYLSRNDISGLADLTPRLLTNFLVAHIRATSVGTGRNVCGHLRVFLRFLHAEGIHARELSSALSWPKEYALKTLPRSIPWDDVQTCRRVARKKASTGRRDYAITCLLSVYGLRAVDVEHLCLEGLQWRSGVLTVTRRKNGSVTCYPLVDLIATALSDYITHDRPKCQLREVFITHFAPIAPLRRWSISQIAANTLKAAGIEVPRKGSHTFRHSLVQRLLDKGVGYRAAADYVGHEVTDTTHSYGRLDIERLRRVALSRGETFL